MKITSVSALNYVGMRATLPLVDGVTTLTGPNAGGKTMLVNVIPGILFNEAKLKAGATIGFDWENQGSHGSILLSKNKSKTLWRGTVDNVAQEHNTIKLAQQWLAANFPVNQQTFVTANFLAAFRSGTMLSGQPASRIQLLSDIVGLNEFEVLRGEIAKLANAANITTAMRKRILEEISSIDYVGRKTPKYVQLTGIAETLSNKKSDIKAQWLSLSQTVEDDRPFGSVPLEDLRKLVKLYPERNKAWDAWDEFKETGGYPKRRPTEKEANLAESLYQVNVRGLLGLLDAYPIISPNSKKLQAKLSTASANLKLFEKQLRTLENVKDICPTCGSKIDNKILVASLKSYIVEQRQKIKQLTTKFRQHRKWEEFQEVANRHGVTTSAITKFYVKLGRDVTEAISIIEDFQTAKTIETRWGGEVPTKPEKGRIDIAEVKHEIRLREKGYGTVSETERKLRRLTKKFHGAGAVLSAVSEMSEEQAELQANFKRLVSLREELESLPDSRDALVIVELLKALENKNARNKYIELVSIHLIDTLNQLAPAFFPYPIEFAWTNGKFLANRNNETTDVVLLSGREGRTFMLLTAVAIQLCLPPAKRLRTLFLDELEAGSSPSNRTLLAELIPTLLDYYDNICVVTPLAKSEFSIEGPRYRVTDKKTLVREE